MRGLRSESAAVDNARDVEISRQMAAEEYRALRQQIDALLYEQSAQELRQQSVDSLAGVTSGATDIGRGMNGGGGGGNRGPQISTRSVAAPWSGVVPAPNNPTSGSASQTTASPVPQDADRLEPWPPPVPTRYAIFPRVMDARPDFKTVGDIADALHAELNRSGVSELRYWGAPNGFALVTRIEPIDEQGRPAGRSADGPRPVGWSWGGIVEAIYESGKVLISSPAGGSRILLFVVTDDGDVRHPEVTMRPQIAEAWNVQGRFMLPRVNRDTPLSSNHIAAVFVYEFHKDGRGDAKIVKDSPRSAEHHLLASGIRTTGVLKR